MRKATHTEAHEVVSHDLCDVLEKREQGLAEWLQNNAARALDSQKHLDEGSTERLYWHYGYLMAIRDVLAQLGHTSTPKH